MWRSLVTIRWMTTFPRGAGGGAPASDAQGFIFHCVEPGCAWQLAAASLVRLGKRSQVIPSRNAQVPGGTPAPRAPAASQEYRSCVGRCIREQARVAALGDLPGPRHRRVGDRVADTVVISASPGSR